MEQHHRGPYKRYALIRKGKKMIVNLHKSSGERTFEFYNDTFDQDTLSASTTTTISGIKTFTCVVARYGNDFRCNYHAAIEKITK